MNLVYKICQALSWNDACICGYYDGSADDIRDGFIHFSTETQLRGTLDKHFAGQENLLLITINAEAFGDVLKWEPSRGGQLFPHLYAKLPTAAAVSMHNIVLGADGRHIIPRPVDPDLNRPDTIQHESPSEGKR